ncbi:hypothetical protein [Streptomyces mirabilis]|uniref:hypothetical protein n=1 Tax=Streptomyces mirabilis TaxID=68239 RepID=UPI003659E3C4
MADAAELFGRLAEDLAPRGARLSKMFGMPCLKDPNGKAFVGLHEGELVVRLHRDSPEHAEALAVTGAHLFDPMGGRPMKDWVCLPLAASARWPALAEAAREQPR